MDTFDAYALCRFCEWSSFEIDCATRHSRHVCEWTNPEIDIAELSECPKEKERIEKLAKRKASKKESK